MLAYFKVNVKDREYQFWERNALSVELKTHSVFMQNWNIYIGILFMEGYAICLKSIINSSARFYETGIHNRGVLFPLPGMNYIRLLVTQSYKAGHNTNRE